MLWDPRAGDVHAYHSTSGIVGLRALFEALPRLGHAEVAVRMLLRKDYPSFGFELTNSIEPATTIWELYDGYAEGGSMVSRNHVCLLRRATSCSPLWRASSRCAARTCGAWHHR